MLGLGSVELVMCGRVIQKSGPLRLAIVEGLDVSDSRLGNVPPRYNAALSQELLVIRQNHKTGERSLDLIKWGLIPYWCEDPRGGRKPINATAESVSRSQGVYRERVQNLGEGPRQHRRLGLKGWDCAKSYLVVVTLRSPLWLGEAPVDPPWPGLSF
jgi:hypothetical protein